MGLLYLSSISVAQLLAQSYLTLDDSMDCSLPGSCVHGIFPARVLVWVAVSFSGGSSDPGIEPVPPAFAGRFLITELPGKPSISLNFSQIILSFNSF